MLLRLNFPEAKVFEGDISIQKKYIVQYVDETLLGKRPKYIIMSPPCQGMSSNGVGRIKHFPNYSSKNIQQGNPWKKNLPFKIDFTYINE